MFKISIIRNFAKMLLITLLAVTVLPASLAWSDDGRIRFAIIGDRTGSNVPEIYEQIVQEIERMKPEFIMTVGDMIQGYTTDTVKLNAEWEEYLNLLAPLTAPVHFTPGNHDITYDAALASYMQHVGDQYHSFDYQGLHITVLDNSRQRSSEEIPEEQINWLIKDLERSQKASCRLVFYHKPFWFNTLANGKPDKLHSIFTKYNVDAVFSGHFHQYFSAEYDGITYVSVGSSGGAADHAVGMEYHFSWVTVDKGDVSVAPVTMGSVRPWDEMTAMTLKAIEKVGNLGVIIRPSAIVSDDLSVIRQKISVEVNNFNEEFGLADTLRWEIPAGWTVVPQSLPVNVEPGRMSGLEFLVESSGSLYPVPTLSLDFPYAEGKSHSVEKTLPVARTAVCFFADVPPIIDGLIAEPCWSRPVSHLFAPDGGKAKIDDVSFFFAYDKENLYLAAYCQESRIDSLIATVTEHDGPVYTEDCVGYFFQPDLNKQLIYQIYFGPLGAAFDQEITITADGVANSERGWDGEYEVKTVRDNSSWSIEARIPLAQLGASASSGNKWRTNFRRKQKRFDSSGDWQVPIGYEPESFGILRFE